MTSESRISELQGDISELETLLKVATRKYSIDLLTLMKRKLETQLIDLQESEKASAETSPSKSAPLPKEPKRYQVKLNGYGWEQSDKFVKIFVTLKDVQNIPAENVYCNLTENSMELHVKNLDNKDYLLIINNLLYPISIESSHWKQKTDRIVIFLAKASAGTNWSHMTEIEKRFDEKKNSKLPKDTMEGSDPQDSLMGLMRNMYEKGDDDMKRMINKAWTEGQEKQGQKSMEL